MDEDPPQGRAASAGDTQAQSLRPSPATRLAGTWSLRCCGDTGTTPSMHGTRPRQRTAAVTGVTAVMVPRGPEVRKQDGSQEPRLPPLCTKPLGVQERSPLTSTVSLVLSGQTPGTW